MAGAFRLEDMAADKQRDNMVAFDSCLAAAVDALQQAGQWKGTLESGGSSNEVLAQPEPSLRQVNPCNPSFAVHFIRK